VNLGRIGGEYMVINLDSLPWNQRLKILRIYKDWSQEETAVKCNTTQKVYWSWEIAQRYPRRNSRVAIAKAFGVLEEEIFNADKAVT